ncbi:MAG: phosphoribosylanthranilate isomerase [Paracoccaceae bacterium]|nr:phosphoribosylanthranilate isomerase [Paracoccaceae bacterium]
MTETRPPGGRSGVRIKICCIQSSDEARMAINAGADALGLVSEMPSGPGPIPDGRIRAILLAFPKEFSVLLSSRTDLPSIARQLDALLPARPRALQLVDRVPPGTRRSLKARYPDLTLIQVVHVEGPESLNGLESDLLPGADMLLLDSGRPGSDDAPKQLGGTGRIHDWSISAAIIRQSPVPVWLAGGLTPDNVAKALRTTGPDGPYGVDVCSGLRPRGALDAGRLEAFVEHARATGGSVVPKSEDAARTGHG